MLFTYSVNFQLFQCLPQVHHRTFSNQSFHWTWLLSPAESLARSGFKSSHKQTHPRTEWRHGYAAWTSSSFQNGSSRCRIFYFFFIRIAPTSEAKTTVSNSTQCELFIGDGKKYMVLEWPSPLKTKLLLIKFVFYCFIIINRKYVWLPFHENEYQ